MEKIQNLELCIDAYMSHLPEMLKEHGGQWTVFKGDKPLGFWKNFSEAHTAGMEAYGYVKMLVREVSNEYVTYGRYGRPKSLPSPRLS